MIGRVCAKLLIGLIRIYQRLISPLMPRDLCRYEPTCSHYAVTAIRRKGVVKGVLMGVWRVMRCNPFSKGGWDPVDPEDRPRYLGDGEAARPRADARAAEAGHTTD